MALHTYSRLRAADFTQLVIHLRESKDAALDNLTRARDIHDVARLQGEIDVLKAILLYIDEGEKLLVNRNHQR
jgi:hypothetical protein